jgi:SAM-dependent methyltransferase
MIKTCELCRLDALEPAYGRDRANGSTVYICGHCGLTQSQRLAQSGAAFSSTEGAAEGRDAVGVSSRIALLRQHADLSLPLSVLDVGAGRGNFVRRFLSAAPNASLTAIEPDQRQSWACAFLNRSKVISTPIEETCLPDEYSDIVHSGHTLEHLAAPYSVLADHWRVLKPGGLLVVACRNIGAIRDEAIVEEWFAQNIRYHFSQVTLSCMLHAAGFALIEVSDENDRENIFIVATKTETTPREVTANPLEVHSARALVSLYRSARGRNLSALRGMVAELNALARRGMAICGSGRLLDSLVRHGGLDRNRFLFLSEAQMPLKAGLHEGASSHDWAQLKEANPGVIVVMSDAHANEIAQLASRCAPTTEIIHYSEIVFRAYGRLAA